MTRSAWLALTVCTFLGCGSAEPPPSSSKTPTATTEAPAPEATKQVKIEVSPAMEDFVKILVGGSPEKSSEAVDKHVAGDAKGMNLRIFVINKAEIIGREESDEGDKYVLNCNEGVTGMTLEVIWKGDKIVSIEEIDPPEDE